MITIGKTKNWRQCHLRGENFSSDDPDVGREAEVEEDEVKDKDEQGEPADHIGIAGTEIKDER